METNEFRNPFRPGAGHMPPYLAGRNQEIEEFRRLLQQEVILENLVLTGLRGVGKTVLLDTFKPLSVKAGWLWGGADLSESASISENALALRLITDLSVVTSGIEVEIGKVKSFGFNMAETLVCENLSYAMLVGLFESTPGLVSDKLKAVLEFVWQCAQSQDVRGIVFAYDEAQTMSDHAQKEQYPLSLLLDVFQSLQKKNIPFMLVLSGLPTLFPKLVESRTFAERMFRVLFLDRLNDDDSRDAIVTPLEDPRSQVSLGGDAVDIVIKVSGGYPYFIQFICKELYDIIAPHKGSDVGHFVPMDEITRKLDNDFFSGRWSRATDRQRELLRVIASLPSADDEFTVQEVVEASGVLDRPFSPSHVNQMLATLTSKGLVYKNRHGRYSFAVPLLGQFIRRQENDGQPRLF